LLCIIAVADALFGFIVDRSPANFRNISRES
jgi:hypothetical protein